LRYILPSFYFWDFSSYLRYPPNIVALAGAALLVWSGVALGRSTWPHTRRAWWAWLAIAGILLPASSESDGSPAEDARIAAAVLAGTSRFTQRFEAERLPPRSVAGTTRGDTAASNGEARSTAGGSRGPVLFGPYLALHTGSYAAVATIARQNDADAATELALLQVTARRGREVLAERRLSAGELTRGSYTAVRLPFSLRAPTEDIELTVVMLADADLWIDYVEFVPMPP
jgi:hypothetical protein